jgi:2-hydroxycyclohexanecarboxyl-CoA dehydrogenase
MGWSVVRIDLTSSVALVTGARGGIGRGIVETLRRCGAVVVASDLDGRTDGPNGEDEVMVLDVCDEAQADEVVTTIVERHGSLDIVVNNAGIASRVGQPFTRLDVADWVAPWEVNTLGTFVVSKAAASVMVQAGTGVIVNIASVSGVTASSTSPPYSVTKSGVISFTTIAARDLAPHGIRVNAVCPGMVFTDFYRSQHREMAAARPDLAGLTAEEYFHQKATRQIPLGAGQTPGDVGSLVAFLASDHARAITGQAIAVDGGFALP